MNTEHALAHARQEVEQFIAATEASRSVWTVPRARGKWSPAQVAEHVAWSLEESALDAAGRIETAWSAFAGATARVPKESHTADSRIFGRVALADYIRFQALHVGHHRRQLPGQQ